MCKIEERKLNLLMDLYQLTMSQGYFNGEHKNATATFDMFFRSIPDNGGYAITAGLEQVIDYITTLSFDKEEIEFLRSLNLFNEEFLNYLVNFKFRGNVYAIPEGTPVFPNEPLITVEAPIIDAQLIETMVLLTINHQSLIATKANRIVRSAKGKGVMEFGSRRAQGYDGALYGTRATFIGGADSTANVLAHKMFGIPSVGTMAHSWIQFHSSEYEAFKAYAIQYPEACTLLVDTYDVIKSGVPNAIKVAKEVLEPMGKRLKGIRLDSGDIAYLSKKCRILLDNAGLTDCKIVASNSLDENTINSLLDQGACIDTFGVGERMITSKSNPVFGGVYKLSSVDIKDGRGYIPRIKISENSEKITNPGFKSVWRLFDKETGMAIADVITLKGEIIDESKPYELFDPIYTFKRKTVTNFKAIELQIPVIVNGERVYNSPRVKEIKDYCINQVDTLWDEVKRLINPHIYYVDLSKDLWDLKQELLMNNKK